MSDMLAVYDFAKSQISFDFFTYLALADLARRESGSERLCILLVPADGDGFRRRYVPYDLDQKRWRLRNVVVDGAGLLPSCAGVLRAASRDHAKELIAAHDGPIYPHGYSLDAPVEPDNPGHLTIKANYGADVQVFRASAQAKAYAQQWLDARRDGRKAIALTLREAKFSLSRNVTLDPWEEFARYIQGRGYFPFFLRDIDTALDVPPPAFDGIVECPAAVFNVDLRLALYELCYLNVFAFAGPMWLSALSRHVRFIGFPVGDAAAVNNYYEQTGFLYGETVPILNHLQRFIWLEPDLPALIEAFEAMEARLGEHDAVGCPDEDYELDPAYRLPAHLIAQRFFNVNGWPRINELVAEAELRGDTSPELYAIKKRADAERRNFTIDEDAYQRAVTFRSDGNHAAAIDLLRTIVERRPTEVNPYVELGLSLEAVGRIHEAEALYRAAISRQLATIAIVYRLGCIAQGLGDIGDAQACFEMILARAGDKEGIVVDDVRARLAKLLATQP